ncbi:MAG: hypothetical protein MPK62_14825, partial [Alphaproteobacteria bacterium]|nr:hypothetical protein [Alphaproteobacteria bacterium]
MKPCKNCKSKQYTGKENTPLGKGFHAEGEKIGTVKTGTDGSKYVVVKWGDTKRWKRVSSRKNTTLKSPRFELTSDESDYISRKRKSDTWKYLYTTFRNMYENMQNEESNDSGERYTLSYHEKASGAADLLDDKADSYIKSFIEFLEEDPHIDPYYILRHPDRSDDFLYLVDEIGVDQKLAYAAINQGKDFNMDRFMAYYNDPLFIDGHDLLFDVSKASYSVDKFCLLKALLENGIPLDDVKTIVTAFGNTIMSVSYTHL